MTLNSQKNEQSGVN